MVEMAPTARRSCVYPSGPGQAAQPIVMTELCGRTDRFRVNGPEALDEEN